MKPNHICKYSGCKNGVDENGNPCQKHYYACDYCDRVANWKSMACCFEHYQLYIEEVVRERAKDRLPSRTDKTEEEVKELMAEPIEDVKKRTEKELSEYVKDGEPLNVEKVVERINDELDKKSVKNKENKRK